MENYGFVYIWYDSKNKRYYIGSHWGTEDDGYICSSRWMRTAYKRRPSSFKRRIISRIYTCRKDLLIKEYTWLSMIKQEELKGIRYYNMNNFQNGHWIAEDYAKTVQERISIKTKEAMQRPEVRENYLTAMKNRDNRSSDLEVRAKRSKSMIGKNVGRIHTAETVEKNRLGHLGKVHTDEAKSKIAAAGVFKSMNSKKIKCKYCSTQGNPGNIGRYHNDRCKHINSLSITG